MAGEPYKPIQPGEDLVEFGERILRERDERHAALEAKLGWELGQVSPGMKELMDSREEYQERMKARLRRLREF